MIFFSSHLWIRGSEIQPLSVRLSQLAMIFGKISREKEEWNWQTLSSARHNLAHASLKLPQKWLIREQGRCQITLEADFSEFMGKLETAHFSGLQLWLHAKCEPKNGMPVFHPSHHSASSSFLLGIVAADSSLSQPLPLLVWRCINC
jgi:hypothetical protein